jgi:SOS-response transcriptional repressor LexA
VKKREAVRRGLGRIRVDDDSLRKLGIDKGDLVLVNLGRRPTNGDLCAAFTAEGKLVVRAYYRESNGDIRLTKGRDGKLIQVFAPGAVVIFGRVARIVPGAKGGGH